MRTGFAISLLAICSLLLTNCSGQENRTDLEQDRAVSLRQMPDAGYVCMVDNTVKDSLLLPITFDGKTYYGCCIPCIEVLQSDTTFRYAKDPESGKTISKATAVIYRKEDSEMQVLYFETEENLNTYLNKNN